MTWCLWHELYLFSNNPCRCNLLPLFHLVSKTPHKHMPDQISNLCFFFFFLQFCIDLSPFVQPICWKEAMTSAIVVDMIMFMEVIFEVVAGTMIHHYSSQSLAPSLLKFSSFSSNLTILGPPPSIYVQSRHFQYLSSVFVTWQFWTSAQDVSISTCPAPSSSDISNRLAGGYHFKNCSIHHGI